MRYRLLSTFILVTLSPTYGYSQCTKDTDCKGNRVCESGACLSPTDARLDEGGVQRQVLLDELDDAKKLHRQGWAGGVTGLVLGIPLVILPGVTDWSEPVDFGLYAGGIAGIVLGLVGVGQGLYFGTKMTRLENQLGIAWVPTARGSHLTVSGFW